MSGRFWDLNIPISASFASANRKKGPSVEDALVATAIELGYDGVALNRVVTGKITNAHSRSYGGVAIEDAKTQHQSSVLRLKAEERTFQQKHRLTVVLDSQAAVHTLSATNPVLKQYDILSVQPATEKLFTQCCQTLEIDVITLDFSGRMPYYTRAPAINVAISRGIHFEIAYSASIRDATARRHLITNSLNLARVTKGRNIILTSAAQRALELRTPYDVMNLGLLFGLNRTQSMEAISSRCRSVILHGESRLSHKAVLTVHKPDEHKEDAMDFD